ncbi:hypothetical protein F5878DRAFT_612035 [Lentinula raphanica]|uniref:Uncharacterized protein n=1 Tax=Lentinula raphanica TaxID=153919 RepID=A0AA38PDV1_9AGAR|nr:hypothetical protein F5878DRAFT_612035 [Lentinula raphanica]
MQLLSSKKFYCAFFAGFFVNTFAVPVPGFKADSSLKKFPLTANVVVKPQGTKPQLETHDPIVTMVHSITPLAVKELLSQFPEAETFLKEIKYPELDLHYEDDVKTEKDKFSFEISFTATLHGQPKKESVWPAYPDELYGDIDLDSLKTKNEFNGAITFYSGGRKAGNLGRLLKKFDHGQLVGEQSNAVNQRVVVPSISEKARTTIGNLLPGLSGLRGMGKAPGSIDDSGSTSA